MRTAIPRTLSALSLLLAAAACGDGFEPEGFEHHGSEHEGGDELHEHTEDVLPGINANQLIRGLAHPGRWQPSAELTAIGDQQNVTFNGAPPYDDGANCSGSATDGARFLRARLREYFPQISGIGIYNCRKIAGTDSMSLHGVGRALDIMIPTVDGQADNDLGDPIARFLIENAQAIGVQTIIWDKTIWRVTLSPRAQAYGGSNPHKNHLHVEINIAAGNEDTSWFAAPYGPVVDEEEPQEEQPLEEEEPPSCDSLPAAEQIIDDGHPCFALFGPMEYWRAETGVGHDGSLLWTDAFESDTRSNWARWSLPLEEPGEYALAVTIDDAFGEFAATRYKVRASGTTHLVVVDQSAASGWVPLGTYLLSGDGTERVVVEDNYPTVPTDQRRIVVDALRLTPAATPTPPDEEEPPPSDEDAGVPAPSDEEPPLEDGLEDDGGPDDPLDDDEKDPDPEDDILPADLDDPGTVSDSHGDVASPASPPATATVEGGCSAAGGGAPLLLLLGLFLRRPGKGRAHRSSTRARTAERRSSSEAASGPVTVT